MLDTFARPRKRGTSERLPECRPSRKAALRLTGVLIEVQAKARCGVSDVRGRATVGFRRAAIQLPCGVAARP
jgi:hypothetical protein